MAQRRDQRARVEHLVESERAGPRVRSLQAVDDRPERVDDATERDEDECRDARVVQQLREDEDGDPAQSDVERDRQPARGVRPGGLQDDAEQRTAPDDCQYRRRSRPAVSVCGMLASISRQVLPPSSDIWTILLVSLQPVMPTAMRAVAPVPDTARPAIPMLVELRSGVQVLLLLPPNL